MNIQRIRKGKIIDERKKITTAINPLNNNVTSVNRLHTKSLSVGNKKIGDIQVVESHSSFYEVIGERKLITVLEVILMINQIDTSSFIRITDLFDKYLLGYSDYRLKAYVQDEYPRSAYI